MWYNFELNFGYSLMTIFKLPDLGEGLAEAEIVEWLIKPGDHVKTDQHLVSVETAKAVVDIPSPFHGVIKKIYGKPGDAIPVGNPLIEFESEEQETSTTVAGKLEIGNTLVAETAQVLKPQQTKATPAVRALAKQLNVDLSQITGTGHQNAISREDILQASQTQSAAPKKEEGVLHGMRRTMAKVMSQSQAQVVPVTIYDDANISAWPAKTDITVRVIRAIVTACKAEPTLNAWFKDNTMQLHEHVNLGLAIDTADGLFVPVLPKIDESLNSPEKIREQVNYYKDAIEKRSITPAQMQGATFTLSNFGIFAGRYASPVVVPPQVAILAIARIRDAVLAIHGEAKIQRVMPLSLTFDHRAATGGEATRFFAVLIKDLEQPQ
jgi:2-oxoisovalerate dehydrogenase E2 component (dihydrolipoyl transacylase)